MIQAGGRLLEDIEEMFAFLGEHVILLVYKIMIGVEIWMERHEG